MTRKDQIRTYLMSLIETHPANTRLPTEHELMKQFNVARQTVQGQMAQLAKEGLVVRRRRAGTFIASGTAPYEHGLAIPPGERILLIYPNWFAFDIWQKVLLAERLAFQQGYVPCHLKLDPTSEMGGLRRQIAINGTENRIKGMLLIPPGASVAPAELAVLDGIGVPCAIMVPVVGIARYHNLHSIGHDYERAGRIGVDLLLRKGHRRFAYIPSEPWSPMSERLIRGMRAALKSAGISVQALRTPRRHARAWAFSPDVAVSMAKPFLNGSVTALLVDSTEGGLDAILRACYLAGLHVPRDISLVAFSDRSVFHNVQAPQPCLVTTPRARLVAGAMDAILNPAPSGGREIVLPVEVVPGESVADARDR